MRLSDGSSDVCSSDRPSVQALCPCATMWLVKAPKPPLDEQIPQASIAPGDISAEQAEAMADAAHLQRWKEIWAEIAAKRQSAEPLTHKESSRRRAQAMVGGLNRPAKIGRAAGGGKVGKT